MAYAPGFTYDIFISYSHFDNLSNDATHHKGWVDQFHACLEMDITRRIAKYDCLKIWRDPNLAGNQLFNEVIQKSISESAIFIALLSTGYQQSEYCQKELSWFYQLAQNDPTGLKVGDNRYRIFNVLLTNIDYHQFPTEMGKTSAFPFHDAQSNDDPGDPTDPSDPLFQRQLKQLSKNIVLCLKAFQTPKQSCQPSPVSSTSKSDIHLPDPLAFPKPDESFPVFFSEVAESLATDRKRTIIDLKENGVYVMDDIPPPYLPIEDHDEAVIQTAKKAQLTVHLLNENPGPEIKGTNLTYPSRQLSLCNDHSNAQLIWTPQNLTISSITSENHRLLIQNLDQCHQKETRQFIQGNRDELLQSILDYIKKSKQVALAANQPTKQTAVLLDTHVNDYTYAAPLTKWFMEHQIPISLNPIVDNPKDNMDQFLSMLQFANAMVMIYGNVNPDRIIKRVYITMNLIYENGYSDKPLAIILVPPKKDQEKQTLQQLIPPKIRIFDNSDQNELKPDVLTPLLTFVQSGGVS